MIFMNKIWANSLIIHFKVNPLKCRLSTRRTNHEWHYKYAVCIFITRMPIVIFWFLWATNPGCSSFFSIWIWKKNEFRLSGHAELKTSNHNNNISEINFFLVKSSYSTAVGNYLNCFMLAIDLRSNAVCASPCMT